MMRARGVLRCYLCRLKSGVAVINAVVRAELDRAGCEATFRFHVRRLPEHAATHFQDKYRLASCEPCLPGM